MKVVSDLFSKINQPINEEVGGKNYQEKQFDEWGEEKNILFVDAHLSGRHLYKIILPYFGLMSSLNCNKLNVSTSI